MEYVMVPVPEEFVAEVTQYLHWNTGTLPPDAWDDAGVASFLDGLDEQARALLLHAARASDELVILSILDAARAVPCTEREVLGLVLELNDAVRNSGGPPFVLATTLIPDATTTGPQAWTLNMPGPVATFLLNAEKDRQRRRRK